MQQSTEDYSPDERYHLIEEDFVEAAKNGIPRKNVIQRVEVYDMPIKEAVTKPLRKKHTYDPKMLELAEKNGLLHLFRPRVNTQNYTEYRAATEPVNTFSEAGKKSRKQTSVFTEEHKRLMEENGISPGTARQRINYYGMPVEEAVTKPLSRRGNKKQSIGGNQS